jgi:hypothetical protein
LIRSKLPALQKLNITHLTCFLNAAPITSRVEAMRRIWKHIWHSNSRLYRPLVDNHFRLLTILSGSGLQPIACQLNAFDLSESPAYEALSYVWGHVEDRLPITVNSVAFAVTRNLHAALYRLRYPDKDCVIWVDAICINQADAAERSSQVQQMERIYSLADQVV